MLIKEILEKELELLRTSNTPFILETPLSYTVAEVDFLKGSKNVISNF